MKSLALAFAMKKKKKMEHEGKAELPDSIHKNDIVDRILEKKYSLGGIVSNESEGEADEKSAEFDDLVLDDHLTSTNSGAADGDFLGDEQESEDRKDIVARIMKQRSMKQRNPRPA